MHKQVALELNVLVWGGIEGSVLVLPMIIINGALPSFSGSPIAKATPVGRAEEVTRLHTNIMNNTC